MYTFANVLLLNDTAHGKYCGRNPAKGLEILRKTPVGIDQTRTSLDISHINLSIPLCQMFLHHPFRIPFTSFHSNYNSKV